MKVWITKYALTQGILEKEVIRYDKELDCVTVANKGTWNDHYHGEGKEWHKTEEEAIEKANILKNKKIESLNKQINKLEKITFK